ncbi:DUF605-domain-containing protein [Aspergillus taichungensis]|uniref:DUF605-domain-containing protein n=1 Tax=Aspergillus taichungensis TaxID=482145 RepID=A0A2J5HMM6_9EURO|nr:DUF605-domain-containing protein [Aspergillus taichungensis]
MASTVPASLKSADIGRYALRAAQLESARPVIAYWCNFYIVNQIIEKGLHSIDDEVKLYTTNLVDKLEQFKNENQDNDAVMDAVAASAYVEQFATEIFSRAEAAMRANKVTKQTADTFQAAATFFELCQIWNPPEPEVAAKTKFAKYHALRIAKAIKAGEDPNATNPVIDVPENDDDNLENKQDDPEVRAIMDPQSQETGSQQPKVEETSDEPAQAPRSPPTLPHVPATSVGAQYSPEGGEPTMPEGSNVGSAAGGDPLELPSAPTFAAASGPGLNLPDTPSDIGSSGVAKAPDTFQSFPSPSPIPPADRPTPHDPSSFYSQPSGPSGPSVTQPPTFTQPPAGNVPVVSRPVHQPIPVSTPPAASAGMASGSGSSQTVDDHAISLAQKHARWAVSALTFDDVNTAIKELRNSLKHLGAE